jgi:hypothetical protein
MRGRRRRWAVHLEPLEAGADEGEVVATVMVVAARMGAERLRGMLRKSEVR